MWTGTTGRLPDRDYGKLSGRSVSDKSRNYGDSNFEFKEKTVGKYGKTTG